MLVRDLVSELLKTAQGREVPFLLREEVAILSIYLATLEDLKLAMLFGSRARGNYDYGSDWDVLLVFGKATPEAKAYVDKLSSDLVLDYPDIVLSPLVKGEDENISDFLAEEILRDGIILFSKY